MYEKLCTFREPKPPLTKNQIVQKLESLKDKYYGGYITGSDYHGEIERLINRAKGN